MQKERTFRIQQYVDPLFGSERFVSFEPDWVESVEEGSKWLIFRPRTPVTRITFKGGNVCTVHGHWAQRIKDAQAGRVSSTQSTPDDEPNPLK